MTRLVKSVYLALLLFATAACPAISEESNSVRAEGVAAIQGNARNIARNAAIEDAQKRAVEQAIGILIGSQTQVENYRLISDKILAQTKGYIRKYDITGETVDSGLLRVRINAEVAFGKLTDDLSGIGISLGRMHKPRTLVMIAEQNIGREIYAWWLGAPGELTDVSVVENAFMDKFRGNGFEFIDHRIALKEITVTGDYRTQDLTVVQARTLAAQANAEVVIIGKAITEFFGNIDGGMKSVQADLTARAVRIDTGQVIATATTHAAAVHTTEIIAGTEALRKAANEAAQDLMGKILLVYAKEGGTRSVNITVNGLNKTRFAKFKDVFLKQVRSIKDLNERNFTGTTARISVDSKNSTQILSDELLHGDFGAFTVEVMGSTASSLELKVTPK